MEPTLVQKSATAYQSEYSGATAPQPPPDPFWQQHLAWYSGLSWQYPCYNTLPTFLTGSTADYNGMVNNGLGSTSRAKALSSEEQRGRCTKPIYPDGSVDVYLDNKKISEISIRTLVRFSVNAAAQFPRPEPVLIEATMNRSPHVCGVVGERPGLATSSVGRAACDDKPKDNLPMQLSKRYDITMPGDPWLPSETAVRMVLYWMTLHQASHHEEVLAELISPMSLPQIQLVDLVDVFEAAIAFDLRPKGIWHRPMREEINRRLTMQPPKVYEFKLIRECLPIDREECHHLVGGILKRLITSYLEHRDFGMYSAAQLQEIETYIAQSDDFFRHRVTECRKYRSIRQRAQLSYSRREYVEAEMDLNWALVCALRSQTRHQPVDPQLRETQRGVSHQDQLQSHRPVTCDVEGSQSSGSLTRRRRPRRKQIEAGRAREAAKRDEAPGKNCTANVNDA